MLAVGVAVGPMVGVAVGTGVAVVVGVGDGVGATAYESNSHAFANGALMSAVNVFPASWPYVEIER
jgi:hypothetical protein